MVANHTVSETQGFRQTWFSHLLSGSFQFLGAELKSTGDETLFLELALRGYNLSRLRETSADEAETAEIIKIG